MKKCIFLLIVCIAFSIISCSYNIPSQKNSQEPLKSYIVMEPDDKIIFEKSGELVEGFFYEINDDNRTVAITGNGELTPELFDDGKRIIWAVLLDEKIFNNIYKDASEGFSCSFHSYGVPLDTCKYTLKIGDGITRLEDLGHYFSSLNFDSIYIGKNVNEIDASFCSYSNIRVDPDNPYIADYNNCIYTKDFTTLLFANINEANVATFEFHPNMHIIASNALCINAYSGTLVIPWGVTTFAGSMEFGARDNGFSFVFPDTLTNLADHICGSEYGEVILSGNNKELVKASQKGNEHYGEHKTVIDKNYYDYYGIKPNSLKTFQNGKTYYFDNNYKMATGWKKVNGIWYYFNDYGAAVVKIWLKSGGKWYYLQEDGTMATSKWIKWYNKWYYVGKDGAMYANCKTPDGYYVNASGVWVK